MAQTIEAYVGNALDEAKISPLHRRVVALIAAGYFFDVLSNGFGAMPSYANRMDVFDRWAIVAYVRALQFSQNARIVDVPDDQRHVLSRPPNQPAGEQR